MSSDRPIRTIAVAGGGIVGFSAAIAFARALPTTRVSLVETTPDPSALADLLPTTWSTITQFHAAIGLDEAELVRAGIATHHLGTTFHDWSADRASWLHAFGAYGKPIGAIPFDHLWWRAHQGGDALPYDRYSVGAALARAGKFVHPAADPASLGSRYQYGLRVDPSAYRERLKTEAAASGATVVKSDVAEIELSDRLANALLLDDGSRVQADMFVDCTGPSARLISKLDDSFENWSCWMPFDRVQFSEQQSDAVPSTADRASAADDGWTAEWPLSGRTLRAELRIGGSVIALMRGRRLRPWVGNVLALGDSAAAFDPLHGMNLDLAQRGILLALELLPTREFDPVETGEYNRRFELVTRRVRDFIALHYLRSGRTTGVWAAFAKREPPDSLARTLDQYEYRGRLPFHEEESVTRDSWTASLIGLGVLPIHADPQASGIPLDKVKGAMRNLAAEIEQSVAAVPDYADYLARMKR